MAASFVLNPFTGNFDQIVQVTVGTFGATPTANGATITTFPDQTLTLQPADGSNPGLITAGTQTIGGNKTFSGTIAASNLSGTNTGNVTLTAVGATPSANGASLSGQALTLQPADGSNPGLITAGAQTIGGAKTFSGAISASNLSGTNTGDITLAAVGSTANANGASLAGQVLTLQPASATLPGVVIAGTQTFGGIKTFGSAPNLSSLTASLPLQLDASKNIVSLAIPLAAASTAVSGILPVPNGGTGLATLTTGNVILGAGTSTPTFVAPGTSGNVLTSNGATWLSSPAAAGIVCSARYTGATGTITSTNSLVTYTTVDYDTDSAYVSGKFTVPTGKAGKYLVAARVLLRDSSGTWAGTISIVKNSATTPVTLSSFVFSPFTAAIDVSLAITDVVNLAVGDTIEIQASGNGTGMSITASASLNTISICRQPG